MRLDGWEEKWTIRSMDRREQMERWLALRAEQSLTFRELSKRSGVPAGTLASWAWKLRRREVERSPRRQRTRFVELVASSDAGGEEGGGRIEIVLGGDRRVLVVGEVSEVALERVVRALERC